MAEGNLGGSFSSSLGGSKGDLGHRVGGAVEPPQATALEVAMLPNPRGNQGMCQFHQ